MEPTSIVEQLDIKIDNLIFAYTTWDSQHTTEIDYAKEQLKAFINANYVAKGIE